MKSTPTPPTEVGLGPGTTGKEVSQLQRLLIDLGYLRLLDDGLSEGSDPGSAVGLVRELGTFDQATARALRTLQQENGLVPSEVLDEATLDFIGRIFCRASAAPVIDLVGDGPKRIYTYEILNGHPALPGSSVSRAIEQAFSMWAVKTPLAFVPAAVGTTPDITFEFVPMDGPNGTYGNAIIEFDEEEVWVLGPSPLANQVDFISIALHEIGHKLGLEHKSGVPGSVMKLAYNNGDRYRFLHPVDIADIRAIHGTSRIRDSIWVHGTSVAPELPPQLDLFQPKGPLAVAVGKAGLSSSWFHFAVPTPELLSERSARLQGVRLRVRTYPDSEILQVHIWDGNIFLAKHLLNLGGSPSEDIAKLWDLHLGVARKPKIGFGIGISIEVKFGFGSAEARRVEFVAAGAEFIEVQLGSEPPVVAVG